MENLHVHEAIQALSVDEVNLTQCDLERSKIALASCGRPYLSYLSSCYCAPALSYYSALSRGEHHEKWRGTVKTLHYQFASGATDLKEFGLNLMTLVDIINPFLETIYTVSPTNRVRILWPITFTNIDQYQCHLIELFLQHYFIITHKNYSLSLVPAATVAMVISALSQTKACATAPVHRARATIEYLRQATPDLISADVWPRDTSLPGCLQIF